MQLFAGSVCDANFDVCESLIGNPLSGHYPPAGFFMRIEQGQHACTGPWFVTSMKGRWQGGRISRSHKPTVVHLTLATAFAEAQRLSDEHPRQHYAVFECIGYVKGNPHNKAG